MTESLPTSYTFSRRLVATCDGSLPIGGASAGANEMIAMAAACGKTIHPSIEEIPTA